jgi:flagellar assembly protein FliH
VPLMKAAHVPLAASVFSLKDIEAQAAEILRLAQEKAAAIVTAAQGESLKMRRAAQSLGVAEGRKQGIAEGIEEGKKNGHTQALAEHGPALKQLIETLTKAAAELERSRDELISQGIIEVTALACAVAKRVTKRQGMIDPAVLTENLKEAMTLAVHAADVRIELNPSQLKKLEEELPSLRMAWPQLKHIELRAEPAISPGGVRIKTLHGQVDGELETQLDRIAAELLPQNVVEKL